MQTLSKGANAPLSAGAVTVQVTCSSPVDVSALLLTEQGRVRSDADMVFYNQPTGPGVTHRAGSGGSPDTVAIVPGQVPPDVARVVVTASLDGSGPATFGAVGSLVARVLDEAGSPLVEFPVTGLTTEKALVCVEVYRRAGAWKVRAVGQGYADGLAGIATDFGITVDDPPGAPAAPAATAAPAAPAADLRRPDRSPAAPPPPSGPPVAFPPPPGASATMPAASPGAPAAGAPAGPVNLDKGRVSLRKQQTVSLVKTGAPALRLVRMGLGWDPVRRGADVDLDASVLAFDVRGRDVEKVWYGNLTGFGDAITHSGDNLTGEGEGDDEVITIHLDRLPREVEGLVFTVNSFRGQRFTELKTAYCRLLDDRGDELVRYDLGDAEPKTGVLMAKIVREQDGTWSMTALGLFHDGRNVKKMVEPARATLGWR